MVEKEKALEIALGQIEKQFGKGAIMKLGDAAARTPVATISTGCLPLDYALGVGGIPRGRVVEIFGPESSGKTTIALHIIAEAQKVGGTAAFIDAEHALDPVYAEALGVKVDDLYVSQPDTGEQAWRSPKRSCAAGIRTSWSWTPLPRSCHGGIKALWRRAVGLQRGSGRRRCVSSPVASISPIDRHFINQLREKWGVMFGNPDRRAAKRSSLRHVGWTSRIDA